MLTIRAATRDDLAAIGRLHVENWLATYRGLMPDTFLDRQDPVARGEGWGAWLAGNHADGLLLVAEQDGELVGFGAVHVFPGVPRPLGEVDAIHVRPGDHGRGLGRRLLVRLAAWADRAGCRQLTLGVVEGNPALGFYLRLGGRVAGRVTDQVDGQLVTDLLVQWDDIRTLVELGEEPG